MQAHAPGLQHRFLHRPERGEALGPFHPAQRLSASLSAAVKKRSAIGSASFPASTSSRSSPTARPTATATAARAPQWLRLNRRSMGGSTSRGCPFDP